MSTERSQPQVDLGAAAPAGPPGSLQALRSERTRAALLAAAEIVFARDGFEASRIEDIAAQAGRSRGAFYANFANKTEVFLALRTIAMRRRAKEVRELFEQVPEPHARDRAIFRQIAHQLRDTRSLLLQIEFKLFAVRHPEMLAELSERHIEASTTIHTETLKDLVDFSHKQEDEMRRTTLMIEALLEGFALNHVFSPRSLTQEYLEAIAPTMLEEILLQPE
jgi:AcrR family transcriptional regulator